MDGIDAVLATKTTCNKITIQVKEAKEILDLDDVLYFVADINYTRIHIKGEKSFLVSKTLKVFEKKLIGNKNFCRIHQSHMINKCHIRLVNRASLPLVTMSNEVVLNVSRSKKKLFLDAIFA
jgi:two-component system LytT family response regulator